MPNPPLPDMSWDPCSPGLPTTGESSARVLASGSTQRLIIIRTRRADYAALGGSGYVGENLYATTATTITIGDAIGDWMSEATNYTYATNSCAASCAHYTQIVWRSTVRVGCAVVINVRSLYPNTLVCRLLPRGQPGGSKALLIRARMRAACGQRHIERNRLSCVRIILSSLGCFWLLRAGQQQQTESGNGFGGGHGRFAVGLGVDWVRLRIRLIRPIQVTGDRFGDCDRFGVCDDSVSATKLIADPALDSTSDAGADYTIDSVAETGTDWVASKGSDSAPIRAPSSTSAPRQLRKRIRVSIQGRKTPVQPLMQRQATQGRRRIADVEAPEAVDGPPAMTRVGGTVSATRGGTRAQG